VGQEGSETKTTLRENKLVLPNPFENKLFSHFLFYSKTEVSCEKSALKKGKLLNEIHDDLKV
jgi:hypothetical protein